MRIKPFLSLMYLSFSSILGAEQLYNLKDLEVLDRQKNFEEFLLHVNDIRPSERGKHWKDMFQTMSVGLIDYKIKTKDFTDKSFKQIEEIGRTSALQDDEYFQLKRAQFAKKYLNECFKNLEHKAKCENELSTFWYFSNKDPEIGLELASILEKNKSALSKWPYYQVAIKSDLSPLFCNRPDVQKAIIHKINLETFKDDFDDNYKTILDRLVPEKCFVKLVETLREALKSDTVSGSDKELALNLLEAKNQLSPSEMDLYSILYLLDGPVVGNKLNIAWKKVEALAENYTKRQKIIDELKSLESIPDEIFKDPNLPRHKAIINLFAKSFPEFLNFYGKNCIQTSSLKCDQFFKSAKNNNLWVSDSIQSQYSGLKK